MMFSRRSGRIAAIAGSSTLAAAAVAAAIFGATGTATAGTPAAALAAPTVSSTPSVADSSVVSTAGTDTPLDTTIAIPAGAVSAAAKAGKVGPGCHQLNRVDRRMKRFVARGNGPAQTKGSVAHLRAAAAAATKAGHADEAKKLTERADRRAAMVTKVAKTKADLTKLIATDCK